MASILANASLAAMDIADGNTPSAIAPLLDELRHDLLHLLPEGQPFFERESATDQTSEERITELIREKALQLTRDEVPHSISVEIDELDEKLLRAFVLVETESQKQILVGKKGAMIREIGTSSRWKNGL